MSVPEEDEDQTEMNQTLQEKEGRKTRERVQTLKKEIE